MATPRASALKQPLLQATGAGQPTRFASNKDPSRFPSESSVRWRGGFALPYTVLGFALVVTMLVFCLLNMMHTSAQAAPSPLPQGLASNRRMFPGDRKAYNAQQPVSESVTDSLQPTSSSTALDEGSPIVAAAAAHQQAETHTEVKAAEKLHPFQHLQHYYSLQPVDSSPRCQQTGICDGDHSCGPDNLGCVTDAKERQQHVQKAIAWSWEGYRKYAWGQDEVDVVTHTPKAWFNLGLTIVDSLDTLLLAGLQEEYQQARDWVANHLEFRDGSKVQFFEVNIRILGGLLSAYYLSAGDDVYLQKAQDLADRLMVAFNTTSGMPTSFVTFQNAEGRSRSGITDSKTNLAEAGTMSLEFTTLGRLLGRSDMSDAGMKFWHVLSSRGSYDGLYCMGIDTRNADCTDPKMTIGSAADSMYEYMLKQWLLSGKTQEEPLNLYRAAMSGIRKHLVRHVYDGTADMSFVSEATINKGSGVIGPANDRFEHLTCFAGGMFVLGKLHNISTNVTTDDLDDVTLGARIGRACYELYHQAPTGVAPDSVHYQNKAGGNLPGSTPAVTVRNPVLRHLLASAEAASSSIVGISAGQEDTKFVQRQLLQQAAADAAANAAAAPQAQQQEPASAPPAAVATWTPLSKADFLRPEAVETLFYLWRATGDELYREWGWNMFRAFEKFCRMDTGGYSTLEDVNQVPPKRGNKMESFWIAETLKYFHLLFEDDPSVLPLDKWVFNTEAHPLPVWGTEADILAMQRVTKQREEKAAAAAAAAQQLEQTQQPPQQEQQPRQKQDIVGE